MFKNNEILLVGLVIGFFTLMSWVVLPTALVWALSLFIPQIQFTAINVVGAGVLLFVLRYVFKQLKD